MSLFDNREAGCSIGPRLADSAEVAWIGRCLPYCNALARDTSVGSAAVCSGNSRSNHCGVVRMSLTSADHTSRKLVMLSCRSSVRSISSSAQYMTSYSLGNRSTTKMRRLNVPCRAARSLSAGSPRWGSFNDWAVTTRSEPERGSACAEDEVGAMPFSSLGCFGLLKKSSNEPMFSSSRLEREYGEVL